MMTIRPAAVAGMFYPANPAELRAEVDGLLADAAVREDSEAPKALVVPHAGYVYSGQVAASAYAMLGALRGKVRRIVLFGPAHRAYVSGIALPAADCFATPLGQIPIDKEAVARVVGLPGVSENAGAHAFEHSLEVQLPFLQCVLGSFKLVPLAVGDAEPADVARVIEALADDPGTLIVISSDLSHYHPYGMAARIDRATAERILTLSADINHEQACGATPINGALMWARRHGMRIELIDLRNSGDTAGDKNRVVGYASFAIFEKEPDVH